MHPRIIHRRTKDALDALNAALGQICAALGIEPAPVETAKPMTLAMQPELREMFFTEAAAITAQAAALTLARPVVAKADEPTPMKGKAVNGQKTTS